LVSAPKLFSRSDGLKRQLLLAAVADWLRAGWGPKAGALRGRYPVSVANSAGGYSSYRLGTRFWKRAATIVKRQDTRFYFAG